MNLTVDGREDPLAVTLRRMNGMVSIPRLPNYHDTWKLGQRVRKEIRIALEEMSSVPYKRRKEVSGEVMILVRVPLDYKRMGNWDLGKLMRARMGIK